MLHKFKVENYKIFDEPVSIDFSRVRDYKFNEDCINNNTIFKAMLYGKNAVGKTSFGQALLDIRNTILPNDVQNISSIAFLNANSQKDHARFEYTFEIHEIKVEYIYEKYEPNKLKYEYLKFENEILYEYDFKKNKGNFNNLKKYKDVENLNLDEWNGEISILRYILTNSKLKDLNVLKKLSDFVSGMAMLKPSEDIVRFKGPRILKNRIITSIIEENLVEDFVKFLKSAGLEIDLKVGEKPDGEKALYFNYKKPLEFIGHASSGTRALTSLYWIIHCLSEIKFLFVDEFDANFHFELAEYMLEKFKSLNDCQILITTHNTDLMSNKYMRPDCYYIMIPNKITSIAEASLRELRQGHNLEKLYQSGEFNGR
ncbi:AAA family ATPase [Lysinibacillus endophyticus]|uniref:AAA family ATPase n=1 Tax=Ureibacillus endophyticus TaxID=1978490 RepID=UPI0020A0D9AE|nr:ATP-binding protein [Lysinibacillus endophyticus]